MEKCNMEALKFSKIEKKTSEYYKEITGVSYIPSKVHHCIIKRKKGEITVNDSLIITIKLIKKCYRKVTFFLKLI